MTLVLLVVFSMGCSAAVGGPVSAPSLSKRQPTECRAEDYDRSLFKHWVDADSDGLRTNHEVLLEECLDNCVVSEDGRSVVSGKWVCPYTGEVFTRPSVKFVDRGGKTKTRVLMDVDHVCALGEAWRWGACHWSAKKREEYANYLDKPYHLVAVKAGANRSKGDRGVADGWLPEVGKCRYLTTRVAIWRDPRWGFKVPQEEVDATLDAIARYCVP